MKILFELKELISIYLVRFFLMSLYIIPLNSKKIFFSSYEGRQFSCNPKYLFLKLRSLNIEGITYVFEYNNSMLPDELKSGVKVVSHNSIQYIYEILTSKIIITNSGITAKMPIRKSQIVINTWHGGGAYKKVGKDINHEINGAGNIFHRINERQTTYFISSSESFSKAMSSAMGINDKKYFNSGMPRNDIFFQNKEYDFDTIIRKRYHIEPDIHLILYAPTYRGKVNALDEDPVDQLDSKKLIYTLKKKFGGNWEILYRGHYYGDRNTSSNHYINVSDYQDMQELLLAVDVLITDYSSSIWDFSFTDKPAFLFVPDIDDYQGERNFYTDITKWPYKMARNNEELNDLIIRYDSQEQAKRNRWHQDNLGSYEKGIATMKIINELILNKL